MTENYSPSTHPAISPQHAFLAGVVLEGGLGLVGIVLAWLLGVPHPMKHIVWSGEAVLWGLAGTLPALLWLGVVMRLPFRFCREVVHLLRLHFLPILRHWNLGQIALVCVLAGFGEEVLFRGVVQVALQGKGVTTLDYIFGVGGASVLFGLMHAVSPGYVLFATGMGIYLGLLYLWTNNLLVPIIAHAVYDLVVCIYLLRRWG